MAYHHITIGNYKRGHPVLIPPFPENLQFKDEPCTDRNKDVESYLDTNVNDLAY